MDICLSKDVCKKCFELNGIEWDEIDDALWEPKVLGKSGITTSGHVCCKKGAGSGRYPHRVDVGLEPPSACKYKTEHMILGESFFDYMDREPVPYPTEDFPEIISNENDVCGVRLGFQQEGRSE